MENLNSANKGDIDNVAGRIYETRDPQASFEFLRVNIGSTAGDNDRMREKLIERINRKDWWHVPPADPSAYEKRGKFLASTFAEAEFWGRPLDSPQHVNVQNPLIGDEELIERTLVGNYESGSWPELDKDVAVNKPFAARRYELDARLKRLAVERGFDSIVLMTSKAFKEFIGAGKIPRSLELNVFVDGNKLDSSAIGVDLLNFVGRRRFGTILVDPPWQFQNRTGKIAPEHKRLSRYGTLKLDDIISLPVEKIAAPTAHLYLWCPNALLPEGISVMKAWGFQYKSNLVWHKIRKDGGSDGRGVGFYFRNVTELILFGVRGKNARTLNPGRTQVNYLSSRKREHSRKPDEQYAIIEACSMGPFLELFARGERKGWVNWGNEADESYTPSWNTYPNHSQSAAGKD